MHSSPTFLILGSTLISSISISISMDSLLHHPPSFLFRPSLRSHRQSVTRPPTFTLLSDRHSTDSLHPFRNCCCTLPPPPRSLTSFATLSAASPVAENEKKLDLPWRLDDKLLHLRKLRDALAAVTSLAEKHQVLDMVPRVKSFFDYMPMPGFHRINSILASTLQTLGDYEMYLLKCLVASGQEHVLDLSPVWLEHVARSHYDTEQVFHGKANNCVSSLPLQLFDIAKSEAANHIDNNLSNWSSNNPSRRLKQTDKSSISCNGRRHYNDVNLHGRLMLMMRRLIRTLDQMERFYDCIGGIIGYQIAALDLVKASESSLASIAQQSQKGLLQKGPVLNRYSVPAGPDLSQDTEFAHEAVLWGLEGLPEMGEIYPLGGAGDRLGLVDDATGDCLPVAMLSFCGRTLLEGLIRDLQAREYLYFKVFGRQHITPVAIMTSAAKNNNEHVMNLCESRRWFGRGRDNFFLFEQPLVPALVAENGAWLINEPLAPVLKPGGHGVIWKLAYDRGVFEWFYKKRRRAAIVRQISNTAASTDVTLLAVSGIGIRQKKKFGFASCERKVGAAEGINVLVEQRTGDVWEYGVTSLEYTEFSKLGIADVAVSADSLQAQYPANTNVLFVDLPSVEHIASSRSPISLPGMILNLKKPLVFKDYLGITHSVSAGRMECTMQNIADFLLNKHNSRLSSSQYESLDTFVVFNKRRKVTSSAKRRRKPNDLHLHQTPDGSFLDLTRNIHELLTSCMVDMPKIENTENYLEFGPPFIILLHPGLGPLWQIVRQKVQGGLVAKGSELQIEVAEFVWKDVKLNGSLLVFSENSMGSCKKNDSGEMILHYGVGCGRCRLERVVVVNRGVDWDCKDNIYWQHKVKRFESLEIILHGNAEFEAFDVQIEGCHRFEVPEGHKMQVARSNEGLSCNLEPLTEKALSQGSWYWKYNIHSDNKIHLELMNLQE